jgi:hypothetical protein
MIVVAVDSCHMEWRMPPLMTQMFVVRPAITLVSGRFILLELFIRYWVHATHRAADYRLMNIFAVALLECSRSAIVKHQERIRCDVGTL